jgi:iron complex transport system permease protein
MAADNTISGPIPRVSLRERPGLVFGFSVILLLLTALASVLIGAVRIPLDEALRILSGQGGAHEAILMQVRLPRVVLAFSVGAGLALCGALMQTFFRNPLADPALIGVSAGGALGAVSLIVLGGGLASLFMLPLAAFVGSAAATALVFALARKDGHVDATTMLLAGIAVNALAGAGIGFVTYLATDAQLRNLTFWSLGSLSAATWPTALVLALCAALAAASAWRLAQPLNALLLGDAEARHLGVNVERLKLGLILLTCLVAGAAVALCGVIGFVGLVAPHAARLLLGPDHRVLVPLSALLGATLLAGADVIARTVVAPTELPIGVLTAFIGAPLFLWLLRRRGGAAFHA